MGYYVIVFNNSSGDVSVKKTICLDFDGVIHSYNSGWQGEKKISDSPVYGARESINRLREMGNTVLVHSCRCRSKIGRSAIEKYLKKHDIMVDAICEHKPQADYYVDDNAIKFDGVWDEVVEQISEETNNYHFELVEVVSLMKGQEKDYQDELKENDSQKAFRFDDKTVKMLNELFKEELAEGNRFMRGEMETVVH